MPKDSTKTKKESDDIKHSSEIEDEEEEAEETPEIEKRDEVDEADEDDEDEASDLNEYVKDDFVVGDDEIEEEEVNEEEEEPEEGQVSEVENVEKEKKKRKKKKKTEELELDEDDLELIKENELNEKGHRHRLRKQRELHKHIIEEDEGAQEERENFEVEEIEEKDDFIEETEQAKTSYKKSRVPAYNFDLIQQVFGPAEEMEEEEEKEEVEEEYDEETADKRRKQKLKNIFDPSELQERFVTLEDENIIAQDIPERLQLRFRDRPLPESQELVQETNWIAEKLKQIKNSAGMNIENLKKNIMKVLELLRVNHFEIMYINTYKLNEISLPGGELTLNDLWTIYDLDLEWAMIYSRKKLIEKKLENIEKHVSISPDLKNLFQSSFDKYSLDNFYEFTDFLYSLNPDIEKYEHTSSSTITIAENKPKKPIRKSYMKPEAKEKLDNFAQVLLPVDKFVENIFAENQINVPITVNVVPETVAENLNDPKNKLIKDSLSTFTTLCKYASDQLYYNPIIRKYVKKLYFDKILFSTEPTPKGKKEIDLYNINFPIKRLRKVPITEILPYIWIMAIENEQKGMIKIKFEFPWSLGGAQDDVLKDEIYNRLKNMYILHTNRMDEVITNQWNILRSEVIKMLLVHKLYPHLEKILREELTENAEKKILEDCGKKFKTMIFAQPYTKPSTDMNAVNTGPKVLSFVTDENGIVTAALVDSNGEFQDYMILNYLLVNKSKSPDEFVRRHEVEKKQLKEFVKQHKPDLMVVGADNLMAKKLITTIREWEESRHKEDVSSQTESEMIWVDFGDMTAPKIYAKMDISSKEFKNFNQPLKEAISLARLQQNPLHEILKLWNHKNQENGILYMNLHHLQNNISQDKLARELEKVAVECTNTVGIDINKILQHPHLQAPFQFICGLGPRKSKHILEAIFQNIKVLSMRSELIHKKIVEKTIYMNMSGFIIVKHDELRNEDMYDLLDTTRIHPENYQLAKKIAKDSFDDAKETEEEDYIEKIMKYPQKLEDLDLDDYAQHLESKGKQNMKIVLDFIVRELTNPFHDVRSGATKDNKDLFYKLTKETPFTIRQGALIDVTITKVFAHHLIVRLQCGKEVYVARRNVYEDKKDQIDPNDFQQGTVVKARIMEFPHGKDDTSNDKDKGKDDRDNKGKIQNEQDNREIILSLRASDVNGHKKFYQKLIEDKVYKYLEIKEIEDLPGQPETLKVQNRYIPRKINHIKFKNTSYQGAIEFLANKDIGDFVIRPSSKGPNNLTITWKFYDYVYVHLDIEERYKGPTDIIGRKLILKDTTYDNLDDLIAGYIKPCNEIVSQIKEYKKFLTDPPEAIELKLKKSKEEDPKTIPYYLGFSSEAPQYLILFYCAKGMEVTKEYIKVKPKGLYFHDKSFVNIGGLINWFKVNFKKPEYQKYIKHFKPPIIMQKSNSNNINVKLERNDQFGSAGGNYGSNFNSDTGEIKVKQEGIKVKQENIKVKEEFKSGPMPPMRYNSNNRDSRGRSSDGNSNNKFSRDRNNGGAGGMGNRNFSKSRSEFNQNRSSGSGGGGGGSSSGGFEGGMGSSYGNINVKQEYNSSNKDTGNYAWGANNSGIGGSGSGATAGGNTNNWMQNDRGWADDNESHRQLSNSSNFKKFDRGDRSDRSDRGDRDRSGGGRNDRNRGGNRGGGAAGNNDRDRDRDNRTSRFNNNKPKTCHLCHEEGHFAKECPKNDKNRGGFGGAGGSSGRNQRRVDRSRSRSAERYRRRQQQQQQQGSGSGNNDSQWGSKSNDGWGPSSSSIQNANATNNDNNNSNNNNNNNNDENW